MSAYGSESLTIANSVKTFTDAKVNAGSGRSPFRAVFIIETAQIRYTVDGKTTPTTTVGHLGEIGDIVTILGEHDIENFKAIRVGAVSAVIQPTYFDNT
jgi:hypothetical protein